MSLKTAHTDLARSESSVVLHVEDDDGMALLFRMALQNINEAIELHRLTNGEDAINFLSKEGPYRGAPTPDLIVLDLNLPAKDGFHVLEEIRRLWHLTDVPAIVFTSSRRDQDRVLALSLGAKSVFQKPDNFDAFVSLAERICSALIRQQ